MAQQPGRYLDYTRNDPYDRTSHVELVVPALIPSREYMASIRQHVVPDGSFAIWFLGQNGFVLKDATGPLIAIDPYLTNSCAVSFADLPFRLDRQLPVFIEPEDLDVDVFVTTHSHQDHADPETLRRYTRKDTTLFVGPYESLAIYERCGVPASSCQLVHPNQSLSIGTATLQTTFALPTDNSDLNHTGVLVRFASGLTFYNTGDTAWSDRLGKLLPSDGIDVCAICINGLFHNLSATQAASIVHEIRPRVAVPCHFDMMVNNACSPEMLRVALHLIGSNAEYAVLPYYESWLYTRK